MNRLKKAINTVKWTVIVVVIVVGTTVTYVSKKGDSLYDMPVISYADTTSVNAVQYTAMQDLRIGQGK